VKILLKHFNDLEKLSMEKYLKHNDELKEKCLPLENTLHVLIKNLEQI